MKRGPRPFIVEVRRGQKRALPLGEEVSQTVRSEAVRRAEVALFGTPPRPAQTPKAEPASGTAPEPRRILASLAEAEPVAELAVEPEPKPRRGRKPGKAKEGAASERRGKSRVAENSTARSVPLTPELVNAALDELEKATVAVPRPAALASQRHASATGRDVEKAPRVRRNTAGKAARHSEGKAEHTPAKAASRPPRAAKAVEQSVPRLTQPAPGEPARAPRPSIRGRYAFGTELKPGERWKRRLRRGR